MIFGLLIIDKEFFLVFEAKQERTGWRECFYREEALGLPSFFFLAISQ